MKAISSDFILVLICFNLLFLPACTIGQSPPKEVTFRATIFQHQNWSWVEIKDQQSPQLLVEDVACVSRSPSSSHLAFSNDGDLIIQELSSGKQQVFELGFYSMTPPVWSPTGNQLAFAGRRETELSSNVWLLDITSRELTRISQCEEDKRHCLTSAPDWSSENQIAYALLPRGNPGILNVYDPIRQEHLESYNLDDKSVNLDFSFGHIDDYTVEKHKYAGANMRWSPNAVDLAYVDGGIPWNVHLLNTQTGERIAITNSSNAKIAFDSPAWSADGRWLLLRRLRRRQWDFWEIVGYQIVVVDITTGLSTGNFPLHLIHTSEHPLICPDEVIVTP
jgi:Tol biopolymer transport system component